MQKPDSQATLPPMLDSDPNHRGGRPFIRGTRVSVDAIGISHSQGETVDEIADDFYLTVDQVVPALEYYLANRARIDAEIRQADEETARIAMEWHARRRPVDDLRPVFR